MKIEATCDSCAKPYAEAQSVHPREDQEGFWLCDLCMAKTQPHDFDADTIVFMPDGIARCLWTEAVPLHELGQLDIQRASTVEFEPSTQRWEVRLASNPDTVAFTHTSREICLNWERNTINARL